MSKIANSFERIESLSKEQSFAIRGGINPNFLNLPWCPDPYDNGDSYSNPKFLDCPDCPYKFWCDYLLGLGGGLGDEDDKDGDGTP